MPYTAPTNRSFYSIWRIDPYERINLAGDLEYRDRLEDLKRQMYSRMEAVGDHFESNTYYRDHWVEDRIIRHTATI